MKKSKLKNKSVKWRERRIKIKQSGAPGKWITCKDRDRDCVTLIKNAEDNLPSWMKEV